MNNSHNAFMSKRISVVLPDDIGEVVETMAGEEMRSLSQMGAILIMEAVKARTADKKTLSPEKDKDVA